VPGPSNQFWLLSGAMGLVTVTLSAFDTLVPLEAVRQGAGAATVGVLVALPNLFPIALGLVAGRLVDRGGAGRWLVAGAAGMVLAPVVATLLAGLAPLAFAQVVLGLFHLFVNLASLSVVASISSREALQHRYGWYATSLAAGRMVGPLLAGFTADLAGFRVAFAAVAAVAFVATLATVAVHRRLAASRPDRADEQDAPRMAHAPSGQAPASAPIASQGWRAVTDTAANPGVQLAMLASSGVFVAIAVRQAFLPVYLAGLEYPASTIGSLLSLGALAAVLVRVVLPRVTGLFGGAARALVVCMATVAVAVGALGVVETLAPLALLTLLAGLGTGLGLPLSIATVASHVAPERRGLAFGLRLTVNRSAQLVAPLVVGGLVGAAGFAVGFAVAGALLGLAAVAAALRVTAFERGAPPPGAASDVG
jgi:MFS family permease